MNRTLELGKGFISFKRAMDDAKSQKERKLPEGQRPVVKFWYGRINLPGHGECLVIGQAYSREQHYELRVKNAANETVATSVMPKFAGNTMVEANLDSTFDGRPRSYKLRAIAMERREDRADCIQLRLPQVVAHAGRTNQID